MAKKIIRERKLECELAFGDQKFFACLNNNLPVIVSFSQYVQAMISDKQNLFAALDKDDRKIAQNVYNTRDLCVSSNLKS